MGGDAAGQLLRQVLREGGQGGALGAADVADCGVGIKQRGKGLADGAEGGDGGGKQHEIGTAHGRGADVRKGAVDNPAFEGAFEVGGIGVDAGNGERGLLPFEIEYEGAADQADADQGNAGNGGHGGWFGWRMRAA